MLCQLFDESWGKVNTDSSFQGWVKNVSLSTTAVDVPAIGLSTSGSHVPQLGLYSSTPTNITAPKFYLADPLPGSGSLTLSLVDITSNTATGTQTISSGGQATFGVGGGPYAAVSIGDQVVIRMVLSSGSLVLPFIYWQ